MAEAEIILMNFARIYFERIHENSYGSRAVGKRSSDTCVNYEAYPDPQISEGSFSAVSKRPLARVDALSSIRIKM